jgi:hypothetical protein
VLAPAVASGSALVTALERGQASVTDSAWVLVLVSELALVLVSGRVPVRVPRLLFA